MRRHHPHHAGSLTTTRPPCIGGGIPTSRSQRRCSTGTGPGAASAGCDYLCTIMASNAATYYQDPPLSGHEAEIQDHIFRYFQRCISRLLAVFAGWCWLVVPAAS